MSIKEPLAKLASWGCGKLSGLVSVKRQARDVCSIQNHQGKRESSTNERGKTVNFPQLQAGKAFNANRAPSNVDEK